MSLNDKGNSAEGGGGGRKRKVSIKDEDREGGEIKADIGLATVECPLFYFAPKMLLFLP